MAFEAETQQRQALNNVLQELAKFDSEQLGRPELGSSLSFQHGIPIFTRTLTLFNALSECSLDTIPANKMSPLVQAAIQARDQFRTILEFSIEKHRQDPIARRDELINQVQTSYDSQFSQVSPIIAYAVRQGTDFARLESNAKESVGRLNMIVENNKKILDQKLTEAEATLENVKRAAQEVGVAQHNLLFKAEAEEHKKEAATWLTATSVLAGITLLLALVLLNLYLWNDELSAKLQSPNLIAVKVIIFGLLISGTLWAGRTYRAHRHNYVVNKHRANALSTFEAFVKGATENQTKDAVLLQSTQCIFSSQPSGYITQESDGGMYKQILEIVRDRPR